MQLKTRDKQFIGLGVLLAAISGGLAYAGIIGLKAEMLLGYLPGLAAPAAAVFAWKARSLWGGDVARYLEIIIAGLLIQFVVYDIHLYWHFQEILSGALPVWGMSAVFWRAIFHGLSALSFILIAYGFYLFYTEGER